MGELIDMVTAQSVTSTFLHIPSVFVTKRVVTDTSAKTLLKHIVATRSRASPKQLAQDLSLYSLASDSESLDVWCQEAISALPQEANLVRDGNKNVLNKLVGYAMKASRGRTDALSVRKRLLKLIK